MRKSLEQKYTVFLLVFISLFAVACEPKISPEDEAEAARIQAEIDIKKHLNDVSQPMTEQEYPKLYQEWGDGWMQNINTMLPLAAERVHVQNDCDKINNITLSPSSEIQSRPILLLTCDNNEKYYVSLKDIINKKTLFPISKLFGREPSDFMNKCLENIKPELSHPNDVVIDDAHTIFNHKNNKIELLMPFFVKTGYNTTTLLTAKCTTDASFVMDVKMISNIIEK